jgi:hypothetical protein
MSSNYEMERVLTENPDLLREAEELREPPPDPAEVGAELLQDIIDFIRKYVFLKEKYDLWLDPGFKDVKELARFLVPFDAAQIRCFPVSTRVNAVSNDDPGCVVPSDTSTPAQRTLFG